MRGLLLACVSAAWASAAWAASSEVPYLPELRGQTVRCSDFEHRADGTWTTLRAITVQRGDEYTAVGADAAFRAGGQPTAGLDVGAALDAACPH